jgi:hypothetical protein
MFERTLRELPRLVSPPALGIDVNANRELLYFASLASSSNFTVSPTSAEDPGASKVHVMTSRRSVCDLLLWEIPTSARVLGSA